ncbi:MAG TPA: CPBP family intramembrane glutamic endopeptidase [Holophagaceae bacterium]
MPLDLIYLALVAVVWPLVDHHRVWPAFLRGLERNPGEARVWISKVSVVQQWLLVALGLILLARHGRAWATPGLACPTGWRLFLAIGLGAALLIHFLRTGIKVAGHPRMQAGVRKQLGALERLMPHTTREWGWFLGVALTAGVCEEFLFRGYFLWALQAHLGWWGAAAASLPCFALAHAYQGGTGLWKTGLAGLGLTLLVALFRSLLPAMAVHALVDAGSGTLGWLALRNAPSGVSGNLEGAGQDLAGSSGA